MVKTEQVSGEQLLYAKAVAFLPHSSQKLVKPILPKVAKTIVVSSSGAWLKCGFRTEKSLVYTSNRKCAAGGGRRLRPWVTWFYRFYSLNWTAHGTLDRSLLCRFIFEVVLKWGAVYNVSSVDSRDVPPPSKIRTGCQRAFMVKDRIVQRAHNGKRQVSPDKKEEAKTEREVASILAGF